MYEPGWYHGQGDPADTVRYWDGQAWQGEATSTQASATTTPETAGGIVYYDAGPTTVDLGDIATQKTLAEQAGDRSAATSYSLSPYSVTKASAPITGRKTRGSAFNFATTSLLSLLAPVLLFLFGVRGPLLYAGLALAGLGITMGRAKAVNSIWSGMRTTR